MVAFLCAWWVATARGIIALTLALFVLAQSPAHISISTATTALVAYILVDSVIALIGALALGRGMCGAMLLIQGLFGVAVTMFSLSAMRVALFNLRAAHISVIAWACVIGAVEAWFGVQIGRALPAAPENLIPISSLRPLHAAIPPGRLYLLAGIVALLFAVSQSAPPVTGVGAAIPILGLFAAAFGYLHLRGGLLLGLLRLEVSQDGGVPAA